MLAKHHSVLTPVPLASNRAAPLCSCRSVSPKLEQALLSCANQRNGSKSQGRCPSHAHPTDEQIWRTERRRSLLLSGLSLFPALLYPQAASAQPKRSLTSDKPCTLTFFNKTRHAIKVYWNNFDADKEFFAMIPPNAEYTVDSFASHPWSLVDAESGEIVQEVTAKEGFQIVPIQEAPPAAAEASRVSGADDELQFAGFDGIGGSQADYAPAEVAQVSIDMEGGLAALKVEGFEEPLGLAIGLPEAAALLYASGIESRRPTTLKTWRHSLEAAGVSVERVMLTRLVGSRGHGTYYSRIVLSRERDKTLTSLDSRPSDALALALQSKSPVFVSKNIAKANQEELIRILEKKSPGLGGPSKPSKEPVDFDKEEGVQDA